MPGPRTYDPALGPGSYYGYFADADHHIEDGWVVERLEVEAGTGEQSFEIKAYVETALLAQILLKHLTGRAVDFEPDVRYGPH